MSIRYLILGPPALLVIVAVALAAVAPLAWGIGEDFGWKYREACLDNAFYCATGEQLGWDAWVGTYSCLGPAVPLALVGLISLRTVIRRTETSFEASPALLWPALVLIPFSGLVVSGAILVLDQTTYEVLLEDNFGLCTTNEFAAFVTFGSVFLTLVAGFFAYLYTRGVKPVTASHHDRRPDEVDAIGGIMHRA